MIETGNRESPPKFHLISHWHLSKGKSHFKWENESIICGDLHDNGMMNSSLRSNGLTLVNPKLRLNEREAGRRVPIDERLNREILVVFFVLAKLSVLQKLAGGDRTYLFCDIPSRIKLENQCWRAMWIIYLLAECCNQIKLSFIVLRDSWVVELSNK